MKRVVVLLLLLGCLGQAPEEELTPSEPEITGLIITSSAFPHNGDIPSKYTCQGEDVNPPLEIEGIPEGTVSLVLIVEDLDAPGGTWVHWVVFNIEPTNTIAEDSVPGTECMNDFRRQSYGGPCPPSGTHRYVFIVYSLDIRLDLDSTAQKSDIIREMEGHILAKGELIGLYSRS